MRKDSKIHIYFVSAYRQLAKSVLCLIFLSVFSSLSVFSLASHAADGKTGLTESPEGHYPEVYLPLWPYLRYYEDKTAEMSIDELVKQTQFESLAAQAQFGQTRSRYWFKIDISTYVETYGSKFVIHIDNPIIDHIDLYRYSLDGQATHLYSVGDKLPYSQRPVNKPSFLLPVEKHAAGDTYYLSMSGISPLMAPMYIGNEYGMLRQMLVDTTFTYLVSGMILAMILYNLFLLIGTWQVVYGWYVLYIGSAWLYTIFTTGTGFQYFWSDSPYAQNTIAYLFVALFQWSSFNFARGFLHVRKYYPRIDFYVSLVSKVPLVAAVAAFFGLSIAFKFTSLMTLLVFVLIPVLSVLVWMKNFKPALIFLLCWMFLIVGMLTYNITLLGLVPLNFLTSHAMELGVATESVLISFALAYRIRSADRQAKKVQQDSQRELEEAFYEKENALAMAKASNEAKTAFLKNISHHVKTPIHCIYGNIQLLEGSKLNYEQTEGLSSIKDSATTLFYYLDNLLTYAEILGNNITPIDSDIDLVHEVKESIRMWQTNHVEQTYSITSTFDKNLPAKIRADWGHQEKLLRVLFDTLLLNSKNNYAILAVGVEELNGASHLTLNISGIQLEDRAILENWTREGLTSGELSSLGLEYFVGKRLLELLNGELSYTSVDGGFSLNLTLPCQVLEKEEVQETKSEFPNLFALVVDDNAVNLQVLTALLKKLKVDSDAAESGEVALEKIKEKQYDIILMDCFMPGLSGQETSKIIRQTEESYKDCPILAVSANTSDSDKLSCFSAGMDDFIEKPVNLDKLSRYLTRWSA